MLWYSGPSGLSRNKTEKKGESQYRRMNVINSLDLTPIIIIRSKFD